MLFADIEKNLLSSPRRWLVTGAAGFIGGHLTEKLLNLNQQVLAVDDFSTGSQELVTEFQKKYPTQFQFLRLDVSDSVAISEAFKKFRPEYVLHHAAIASVPASIKDPVRSHRANVDGFLSVLEAARQYPVKKVVYASSSAVYGDLPGLPKTEAHPTEPLSPYAAHKRMNEEVAAVYAKNYGISTVGFRYFNIFGPRQDPRGPYAAVISLWINALLAGEPLKIFGKGKQTRDFVFVSDVVEANLRAAMTETENFSAIYNIGRGVPVSLLELASHLQLVLKEIKPDLQFKPAVFLAPRLGDIEFSYCDPRLVNFDLGFKAQVSLEEGLRQTLSGSTASEALYSSSKN